MSDSRGTQIADKAKEKELAKQEQVPPPLPWWVSGISTRTQNSIQKNEDKLAKQPPPPHSLGVNVMGRADVTEEV